MKRLLALLAGLLIAGSALAVNVVTPLFESKDDRFGFPTYIISPPSYVDALVLVASSAASFTVPSGARFVVFSTSCPTFYTNVNGTAAVPGASVSDGTASMINPAGFFISGIATISVLSPTACIVTAAYFK